MEVVNASAPSYTQALDAYDRAVDFSRAHAWPNAHRAEVQPRAIFTVENGY